MLRAGQLSDGQLDWAIADGLFAMLLDRLPNLDELISGSAKMIRQ